MNIHPHNQFTNLMDAIRESKQPNVFIYQEVCARGRDDVIVAITTLFDQKVKEALSVNREQKPLGDCAKLLKAHFSLACDEPLNINQQDEFGRTLLMVAIEEGEIEIARELIQMGADLKVKDALGSTAMHRCAIHGRLSLIELLISKGCDIHEENRDGHTALYLATLFGHLDVMQKLKKEGASLKKMYPGDTTLFHIAVISGSKELIQWLLDQGTDINARDEKGYTPLGFSVRRGDETFFQFLIEKGAKIDVVHKDETTMLHAAVRLENTSILRLCIASGLDINKQGQDRATPLHISSYFGNEEAVKLLIKEGADIHQRDLNGFTPLATAATGGHLKICRLLIDKGAKLYIFTNQGLPLLHLAALEGHADIVSYFQKIGMDMDVREKINGVNAISIAVLMGHLDVLKVLLQSNPRPDLNCRGQHGVTPLLFAVDHSRFDLAEILVLAGADINIPNHKGLTPLLSALLKNNEKIARLLIENGAKINQIYTLDLVNQEGKVIGLQTVTPLMCAIIQNNYELTEYLLDKGAQPGILTKKQSALSLAVEMKNIQIVRLLLKKGAKEVFLQEKFQEHRFLVLSTALHTRSIPILQELSRSGFSLNETNKNGDTLLHLIQENDREMTEYLLSQGLTPDAINKHGATPLLNSWMTSPNLVTNVLEKVDSTVTKILHRLKLCVHRFSLQPDLRAIPEIDGLNGFPKSRISTREMINTLVAFSIHNQKITPLIKSFKLGLGSLKEQMDSYNRGELVIIPSGWPGHTVFIVIKNRQLFICNRGDGAIPIDTARNTLFFKGIVRYECKKPLTKEHLEKLRQAKMGNLHWLHEALGLNEIDDIPKKGQKIGNCTWTSCKAALHASLYLLFLDQGLASKEATKKATELYKSITRFDRNRSIKQIYLNNELEVKEEKSDLLRKLSEKVQEALSHKILSSYPRLMNTVIESGVSLNIPNEHGFTPLLEAALCGKEEVVDALLKAGANINFQVNYGFTALHLAAMNNHYAIIERLGRQLPVDALTNAGETALHIAVDCGHLDAVQRLLKLGSNPNIRDKDGRTPLLMSMQIERIDIAKALLENGAKIEPAYDIIHLSVIAKKQGHYRMIQWVLESKLLDINDLDEKYYPLLYHSILLKDIKTVKFLLEKWADLMILTIDDEDAFDIAKRNNDSEILKLLNSPVKFPNFP